MNPGPVEEGGKVATSLIESLKSSPMTLALVVFNVIFLITIYFSVQQNREREEKYREAVLKQTEKFAEMLYNCTPDKTPRFPQ